MKKKIIIKGSDDQTKEFQSMNLLTDTTGMLQRNIISAGKKRYAETMLMSDAVTLNSAEVILMVNHGGF